jgi:hypothetical protein
VWLSDGQFQQIDMSALTDIYLLGMYFILGSRGTVPSAWSMQMTNHILAGSPRFEPRFHLNSTERLARSKLTDTPEKMKSHETGQ